MHLDLVLDGVILLIAILCKILLPFALIYFAYYLFVKKGNKK